MSAPLNAHFCSGPCLEPNHDHQYSTQKGEVIVEGRAYKLVLGCPPENLQRLCDIAQVFKSHLVPKEEFPAFKEKFARLYGKEIPVTEAFDAVDVEAYNLEDVRNYAAELHDKRVKAETDLIRTIRSVTFAMFMLGNALLLKMLICKYRSDS